MAFSRCGLFCFVGVLLAGVSYLPATGYPLDPVVPEKWRSDPALAEPDGSSHRGDKMVAGSIGDLRVLAELSRRFRATQEMKFVHKGKEMDLIGVDDFERRQEYLLRLLDYYHFDRDRLKGKTKRQVERIFGPGKPVVGNRKAIEWSAGRDTFVVYFEGNRVTGAAYVMGY